ncbi:2-C-methyl-D-erythritol 2,4-cyclodiphosphate synthase [Stieleria sp. TO1_6]|uniref:2-C-methyl-D-erythritol 2,4-cyclodiphosphate synthase n=1 Tax=Stieleria tagensis TaxID=2956795 RepID=UPI00209B7B1B|nr:2-C-methyl-D-erythritol 2,4-cyclodiphosphate synthase [Stieleria tagensis]MCO8121419.1 2-C-methyl-D-erythritol 2,4-cyclodiphosphate synthase [Stieleria tagensis]
MTSAPLPNLRIGLGYDSHRLGEGGPLRIGGIDIDGDLHAIGHSDADVLLHSITDALLGAVCAADIGRLFPDTADENAGRCSRDFVLAALEKIGQQQMQIVNLDCVILAERPKMAPHIDAMRTCIAEMLGVDVAQVSVKAKTGEGVGEIGTGQSIATRVVVLLAGINPV